MKTNSFFDILGGITLLAIVATVVGSRNTSSQITAAAKGYASIIKAATGN